MSQSPPARPIRANARHPFLILALMAGALLARASYGLLVTPDGHGPDTLHFEDERWYWSMAESYRAGNGMVGEYGHRAGRMPLYPWFLSWFAGSGGGVAGARLAQGMIGALAAPLALLLARPICGSRGAWAVGLVVAFDPALVGCASLLLTETLHVTGLAALWWVALPLRRGAGSSAGRWLAAAALAAVNVYLRESSLLLVVLLAAYLAAARRDRRGLIGAAGILAFVVAALTPWAYRNHRAIGEWCWLTTRAGISLYDGVRPGATGSSDLRDVKDAPAVAGLSESEWNRHFRQAAWTAIREDPARMARMAVVKLGRTWSPVLNAAEYQSSFVRLVFACWYVPLYAAVLLGAFALRQDRVLLIGLLLPAIGLSLVHAVYVGSVRYRLGALPTLTVLAVVGVIACWSRLTTRPLAANNS